ncbi:RND family transporter [Asinibacterium sp. OR53]|uniref:efflux RND transporter permease subunit n=1 Tax=Asinibacterium sp. OR53 TaxID=925409 RepID=UPI0004B95B87|nr:MMPL family transporter [Asinibacterium sp. OR53]
MWYRLGQFILKNRLILLILLLAATAVMGYFGSQVKLSYEFTKAIPDDNPRYRDYQAFLQKFGGDGSTVVIGIQSDSFFTADFFNKVGELHRQLKKVSGVTDIASIPEVVNLQNDTLNKRLLPYRIFNYPYTSQASLDSARQVFENLPFYRRLLYNPTTRSYLMGVNVNKDTVNSKSRTRLINDIVKQVQVFEQKAQVPVHMSGLPYIRTIMSNRIKDEMNWFLIGSLLLSAITLILFFRSVSAMLMSLFVVGMGVVWSLGTVVLFGYKITLLTAIIPPLVVVIGVPNCIYFLNKYHTAYRETGDKQKALVTMVGRMGIVTLFCNIAAAIGFAVFALTRSAVLKEFGAVAGINIIALFLISLIFIPVVLSYLPAPQNKHTRYLDNAFLERVLVRIERWTFHHAKWVYGVTAILTLFAAIGLLRIKSEGFIVDDLPKNDKIYTDLKWFESNFGGVMPLEILVDTKKKNGLVRSVKPIANIEELSQYIANSPEAARPLSFVEGLKFAKQAYFDGDTLSYAIPYEGDLAFMAPYLKARPDSAGGNQKKSSFAQLMSSFMDSSRQVARISVNMKDVGSARLPMLLKDFEHKANEIFDTASYHVTFTGSSITFLEGSSFIIKGLKESICWAFLLITLCMLYLFRSFRILVCSLIPNLIPLVITAGVMGWAGIALKPSTVLVFSVALGIAIDVTIRFLINYKQELPHYNKQVSATLVQTIRHTGISIIYTSLVLIAGFIIFCWSDFGGTKALGWLTSLTLVTGTLTNLILLPVLILHTSGRKQKTAIG